LRTNFTINIYKPMNVNLKIFIFPSAMEAAVDLEARPCSAAVLNARPRSPVLGRSLAWRRNVLPLAPHREARTARRPPASRTRRALLPPPPLLGGSLLGRPAGEGGSPVGEAAAAAQLIRSDGAGNRWFLPNATPLVSSLLVANVDAVSCRRNRFLIFLSLSS
jgi:hypothetical protein